MYIREEASVLCLPIYVRKVVSYNTCCSIVDLVFFYLPIDWLSSLMLVGIEELRHKVHTQS